MPPAPHHSATGQPAEITPGAIPPGLHGLVRVGEMLLAFGIDAIREVTPRPHRLVRFPALRPDIVGAIELRGSIIPVMDVVAALGSGTGNDGKVILILRVGGGVIGMFIDEICGVVQLGAQAFSPLAAPAGSGCGAPALAAAGFVHGALRGTVLDHAAFAALPGIAVTTDHPVDRSATNGGGDPTLLFACAGKPLGLAARAVDASVPVTRLLPPAADEPLWVGMLPYNGRRIPVIDTLMLLGLGSLGRPAQCASVVMRLPEGRLVAFAIDAVSDMRRVQEADILPLQRFAIGEPGLLRGLYRADGAHLLLDDAALAAHPRLLMMAQIGEDSETTQAEAAQRRDMQPFLVAALRGERYAIPLSQVDEIIPAPDETIDLDTHHPSQPQALIAHRGHGVPLLDLAAWLGSAGEPKPARFVVLASHDGDRMGFLLDELVAVERVRLQVLAGRGDAADAHRLPAATIRLQDGASCQVLDLAAIVAKVRDAPVPIAA
ncbi:chemotaxis protein CheW [Novosphingobium sp. KCTC 2891]|uniref:chemotaxis protein CheW n=1 Tax=Novosphingobium sp. KCTC 2891 TaxID=2989730 RepID=UPI002223B920|nr:chemotaxis protein CheW [Novosphingobium sp. KCTC 2891]MCW1382795.1 chemotaxis protein CheW [Novosphingobium sp. KCTC 2891]